MNERELQVGKNVACRASDDILAPYAHEISNSAELAQVAAALLPQQRTAGIGPDETRLTECAIREAVQQAARLLLASRKFQQEYNAADTEARAKMCDDRAAFEVAYRKRFAQELSNARREDRIPIQAHEVSVPEFPDESRLATLNEFFKLVVRAKTPADAARRFRDFLRASVADIADDQKRKKPRLTALFYHIKAPEITYAEIQTERLTHSAWLTLGSGYIAWWQNHIRQQNSEKRLGRTKQARPRNRKNVSVHKKKP